MRQDSELAKKDRLLTQLSQTPQSLIDRLSLHGLISIVQPDIGHAHSAGLESSTAFQSRSRAVSETPEFQKWLSRSRSAVLVVEGNEEELASASPLSFLAALLHEKLLSNDKVLSLPYFGGLLDATGTDDGAEPLSKPLVLLRCMLAQLLDNKAMDWEHGDKGRPCLSFVSQEYLSKLEASSYKIYLSIVADVLAVLLRVHDCIFMMIDGVDYLDDEYYAEMKQLLKALIKLVKAANARENPEVVGSIKVLWTAGTHLEYRPRSEKGVVVLEMSEELSGEDSEFEELSDG
jgi:hypothetical protein